MSSLVSPFLPLPPTTSTHFFDDEFDNEDADSSVFFGANITSPEKRAGAALEAVFVELQGSACSGGSDEKENASNNKGAKGKAKSKRKSTRSGGAGRKDHASGSSSSRRDTILLPRKVVLAMAKENETAALVEDEDHLLAVSSIDEASIPATTTTTTSSRPASPIRDLPSMPTQPTSDVALSSTSTDGVFLVNEEEEVPAAEVETEVLTVVEDQDELIEERSHILVVSLELENIDDDALYASDTDQEMVDEVRTEEYVELESRNDARLDADEDDSPATIGSPVDEISAEATVAVEAVEEAEEEEEMELTEIEIEMGVEDDLVEDIGDAAVSVDQSAPIVDQDEVECSDEPVDESSQVALLLDPDFSPPHPSPAPIITASPSTANASTIGVHPAPVSAVSHAPATPAPSLPSSPASLSLPLGTPLAIEVTSPSTTATSTPELPSHSSVTPKASSSTRQKIPARVLAAPTARRLLSKPSATMAATSTVEAAVGDLAKIKRKSGLIATGLHTGGVKLGGTRMKSTLTGSTATGLVKPRLPIPSSSRLLATSSSASSLQARSTIGMTSPSFVPSLSAKAVTTSSSLAVPATKSIRPTPIFAHRQATAARLPLVSSNAAAAATEIARPSSSASSASSSSLTSSTTVARAGYGKSIAPSGAVTKQRNSNEGSARSRLIAPSSTFGGGASRIKTGSIAISGRPPLSSSMSSILPPPIVRPTGLARTLTAPLPLPSLARKPSSTLNLVRPRQISPPTSSSSSSTFSFSALTSGAKEVPAQLPRPLPLSQSQSFSSLNPAAATSSSTASSASTAAPTILLPRPLPASVANRSPDKRKALRTGEKREPINAKDTSGPAARRGAPIRSNSVVFTATTSNSMLSSSHPPPLSRSLSVPSFHTPVAASSPLQSAPFLPSQLGNSISSLTAAATAITIDSDVATEMFSTAPFSIAQESRMEMQENEEGAAAAAISAMSRSRNATMDASDDVNAAGLRITRRGGAAIAPLPRPTRRTVVVVEAEAEDEDEEEHDLSTFVLPTYLAPPDLTSDELTTLTQRNTKKNKIHFNRLNVETIVMDSMRPPSPTSKIRKSLSAGGSAASASSGSSSSTASGANKESREERANKRRGALRSSTDGSEMMRLASELEEEQLLSSSSSDAAPPAPIIEEVLLNHYRAAGDEEEYRSPVRPTAKKGKKKSSVASLTERRRVKWDKALVYEGMLENDPSTEGVLKRIPLDSFGNSTASNTGYAKPASVSIKRLVYKDDE